MKFYIEITLCPGVDVGISFLWGKVYQQVHLALVDMIGGKGNISVGVSFPEYDPIKNRLGSKLRLFGKSEDDFQKLNIKKWLNNLLDYVHITQIREVPINKVTSYSIYKRQQPKRTSAKLERLIKRKAKRESMTLEAARNIFISIDASSEDTKLKIDDKNLLKAPFISMKSLSSDNQFRLFIVKENVGSDSDGYFSSYGLSDKTTVPEF